MGMKLLMFCCVALLATQFASSDQIQTDTEKGLLEELQQLCQRALDLLKNSIESALERILDLFATISKQIQLESQEAIKDIETILSNTLTEIEQIENEAGQISAEALECILKEKEALKKLAITTHDALIHCVSTSIENAQGLIESAKKKIEEIRTIVGELHIEITECTTLTCLKEVLKKLAEKIPEIIKLIDEIARETVEFLQAEIPKYRACKNAAYENYRTELQVIVLRIKECINDL